MEDKFLIEREKCLTIPEIKTICEPPSTESVYKKTFSRFDFNYSKITNNVKI